MSVKEALGTIAIITALNMYLSWDQYAGLYTVTFAVALMLLLLGSRTERVIDGQGKAVLITGCDSGFGHHLAKKLDSLEFAVFAGCLFPDGEGALKLRRECSCNLKVLQLDVTRDEDVKRAKTLVQSNLPEKGLWAVVNNAGISDWSETEWNTTDDYYRMAEVNLFGSIRTSVEFLPLIRAAKGRMVYVSSIFAFFNCLNMGCYSVSKRGLEAFADCLRVEMASFGVKVSIIQPGNFSPATKVVKEKTTQEIWNKLKGEKRLIFNKEYIKLANEYFMSTCKEGLKDINLVTEVMVDALTSLKPKYRYLVTNNTDKVFFKVFPYLPTFLADLVFALSPMYHRRKAMLFSQSEAILPQTARPSSPCEGQILHAQIGPKPA